MHHISKTTLRRFVLGKQGLWPGRRWQGKDGTAAALCAIEALQLDPLNVVARSHDIMLWGRVAGYRPEYLDQLLYEDRQFFDYGGWLAVYPMTELPFWQAHMDSRKAAGRWAKVAAEHPDMVDAVRATLRERGPLGNRDFTGTQRVTSYRGGKDSALALYYLWITGEVMTHHRRKFERVYDLRANVAPPEHNRAASVAEAERYFARKVVSFSGMLRANEWANDMTYHIGRKVDKAEAQSWLDRLVDAGELAPVTIEGEQQPRYVLADDLALLDTLEAGAVSEAWQPLDTTTDDEAVFLAPLDIVSARGRAAKLFDFEYIWEVYKPVEKRRWGYYTLPILYGDRLVARLDPKLDRATGTLHILGFWLEDEVLGRDEAFAAALGRGLARFAAFAGAGAVNLDAVAPATLRRQLALIIATEHTEFTENE